jgi:Hint domain
MGKPTTCLMNGVRIHTPHGETPVEDIKVGDAVGVRRDGRNVFEPVVWVGYTYIDMARHAHPEDVAPIRIRSGALAEHQPARDLMLSPEHCLVIDGLCIPAKLLVNGGSIVSERSHAPFTYYHLELDRHGVLLADGAPVESYLDTGNRSFFDNAELPQQLHPVFSANRNSERWQTDACAPLAQVPDQVEPIWHRLAQRSEAIGYPVPDVRTVNDADVHILADGRVIRPVSDHDARYVFTIPAGVESVLLSSRFCIPSDKMIAAQRDARRIGVSVSWIAIRADGSETIIPADHPGLGDGWNDPERDGTAVWRWTDGAAVIPWQTLATSAVLTVRCTPVDAYPVYDDTLALVA